MRFSTVYRLVTGGNPFKSLFDCFNLPWFIFFSVWRILLTTVKYWQVHNVIKVHGINIVTTAENGTLIMILIENHAMVINNSVSMSDAFKWCVWWQNLVQTHKLFHMISNYHTLSLNQGLIHFHLWRRGFEYWHFWCENLFFVFDVLKPSKIHTDALLAATNEGEFVSTGDLERTSNIKPILHNLFISNSEWNLNRKWSLSDSTINRWSGSCQVLIRTLN